MVKNGWKADLLIFGAGGHAKVASDCARAKYPRLAMVSTGGVESQWDGIPILPQEKHTLAQWRDISPNAFVAIGSGDRREAVTAMLAEAGFHLVVLIHPTAAVSSSACLGDGTLVCPRAAVNAGAQIGSGCIVNTGAIVEHECVIGAFSHISPGAVLGGGAELGEHCWVCLNASITDHVRIGRRSIVGAGAVVLVSLPEHVLAAGVPARICKRYPEEPV